jgi:hypothetical protein
MSSTDSGKVPSAEKLIVSPPNTEPVATSAKSKKATEVGLKFIVVVATLSPGIVKGLSSIEKGDEIPENVTS